MLPKAKPSLSSSSSSLLPSSTSYPSCSPLRTNTSKVCLILVIVISLFSMVRLKHVLFPSTSTVNSPLLNNSGVQQDHTIVVLPPLPHQVTAQSIEKDLEILQLKEQLLLLTASMNQQQQQQVGVPGSSNRSSSSSSSSSNNNNNNNNESTPTFPDPRAGGDPRPLVLPPVSSSSLTLPGPTNATPETAPRSTASGAAGVEVSDIPFLIIGINSMPRARTDYLTDTLKELGRQMVKDPSHPLYNQVHVYVMNNAPVESGRQHEPFELAKSRYKTNPAFHFLVNEYGFQDPDPSKKDPGNNNVPGFLVRKQIRDVAAIAKSAVGHSKYFMFMEDDFRACPDAFRVLFYATNKAFSIDEKWFSIKFSYGMNGLLLHNVPTAEDRLNIRFPEDGSQQGDLDSFADYLLKHQTRRPPDHLSTEWSCGETPEAEGHRRGRRHFAYRYNLFAHQGTQSTLRSLSMGNFPGCYRELVPPTLFEVEAWDSKKCAHEDISPCHPTSYALRQTYPAPFRLATLP